MLISGHAAFLAILILSERAVVAAWAQHDPQYEGRCWFLTLVRKLVPLTSFQNQFYGSSSAVSSWWTTFFAAVSGFHFNFPGCYGSTYLKGFL